MFLTSHSRYYLPWWISKAFAVKWWMSIAWICSQELAFVLKSEQREALELLLSGKDVFCVLLTGFDKSLIYQMFVFKFCATADRHCYLAWLKRGIGRKNTTQFTSCKNASCSIELFSLSGRFCFGGKRFDWANVSFSRLLNIFHTERSWHAYWFSVVGMICSLMQDHFLSCPL